MPRLKSIQDEALISQLSAVFRDVGYEGASLTLLSRAAGLERASLYHRFPRGKQQMAEEVLSAALAWFGESILGPLRGPGPPAERVSAVSRRLEEFYGGGHRACLLNVLASTRAECDPFAPAIADALGALVSAFTKLAADAGHDARPAKVLAEQAVMMLHGSLVVSRGLNSSRPFRGFLDWLAEAFSETADARRKCE
jgi:AcrR family transcriptional regulator